MKNLGKANVRVSILDNLPGIDDRSLNYNFEISAHNWDGIKNSPYFTPLLTDHISDDSFAACFPSKRVMYFDNVLKGDTTFSEFGSNAASRTTPQSLVRPVVYFTATDKLEGKVKDIVDDMSKKEGYVKYKLLQPEKYTSKYNGPQWKTTYMDRIANPNDNFIIQEWQKFLQSFSKSTSTTTSTTSSTTTQPMVKNIGHVVQTVASAGLWWGLESSNFLQKNMPFWVYIKRNDSPTNENFPTRIIISLGIDDPKGENRYDLIISDDIRPILVDYQGPTSKTTMPDGTSTSNGRPIPPPYEYELPADASVIRASQKEIMIGFMNIAGRMVIYLNGEPFIYQRIDSSQGDDAGKLRLSELPKGRMRIYGINSQMSINVSLMNFAPLAVIPLTIPVLPAPSSSSDQAKEQSVYKGVRNDGSTKEDFIRVGGENEDTLLPVCELPQQPDRKGKLYGVDCRQWFGEAADAKPTGIGFHRQGTVQFSRATAAGITTLPITDFYVLAMKPEDVTPEGWSGAITNGGTPYFFRIKGKSTVDPSNASGTPLISGDVISISETYSAPDYFHVISNANVTLYNKGGKFDFLKGQQKGIEIYWGWEEQEVKTFTGMIVNASTSEVAGKETIELQCQDYMYILKNTPIVNSPFYDGMIGFYAIKDIAERGGINNFKKDWDSEEDYFLPSGYAFTKPAMKYPRNNMLFECMIDIVKRFEAYTYFDADGYMHVDKLPGGLFSSPSNIIANFSRDPINIDNLILDEKKIDYSFDSTVNRISILTVDRNTRNAIVHTRSANDDENNIIFKKVSLIDQAALGDVETCRSWAEDLAQRVFYPIRKSSFKVAGNDQFLDMGVIRPLDFVTVDGDEYRIMSLAKRYSAETNDFTQEYNVEWLGGK